MVVEEGFYEFCQLTMLYSCSLSDAEGAHELPWREALLGERRPSGAAAAGCDGAQEGASRDETSPGARSYSCFSQLKIIPSSHLPPLGWVQWLWRKHLAPLPRANGTLWVLWGRQLGFLMLLDA